MHGGCGVCGVVARQKLLYASNNNNTPCTIQQQAQRGMTIFALWGALGGRSPPPNSGPKSLGGSEGPGHVLGGVGCGVTNRVVVVWGQGLSSC